MSDGMWTKLRNALAVELVTRALQGGAETNKRMKALAGEGPYSPEALAEMQAQQSEALAQGLGGTVGAIKPKVPYANLRKQLLGADITEMSPVQYGKHLANIRPRTTKDLLPFDSQILGAHAKDVYQTENPWEVVDRHLRANKVDPGTVGRGSMLETSLNNDTFGLYGHDPRRKTGSIFLLRDPEKFGASAPGIAMHEAQHAAEFSGKGREELLRMELSARQPGRAARDYSLIPGAYQGKLNPWQPGELGRLKSQSRMVDALQHERIRNAGHHVNYDYMEYDAPYRNVNARQIMEGGEIHPDALAHDRVLQNIKENYRSPIRPTSTGNATPAPPKDNNLWKILGAALGGGAAMKGIDELKNRPEFWEELTPTGKSK